MPHSAAYLIVMCGSLGLLDGVLGVRAHDEVEASTIALILYHLTSSPLS
jgi:hypothetical protein